MAQLSKRCESIVRPVRIAAGLATALTLLSIGLAPSAHANTTVILPGQNWATILKAAPAGSTVTVKNGTYPVQYIRDFAFNNITVKGETKTGVIARGIELSNVSGLTLRSMSVTGDATAKTSAVLVQKNANNLTLDGLVVYPSFNAGIDLQLGARQVRILNSTIDGRNVLTKTGRGIRIFGDQANAANWIADVEIRGNEVRNAAADLIFIAGGRNVLIKKNWLHDPQQNSDHNDGVQSAGSDGLVIDSNTFTGPGAIDADQAIILGHSPTNPVSRVTNSTVVNNVIRDWRGTGIIVSGADNTLITNNSVARTGTPTFRNASLYVGEPYGFTNTNVRVQNNVFEKITPSSPIHYEDYNCVRTGGTGAHNVTADPQLADLNKLTLKSTSPCLNIGTVVDAPLVDYAGTLRVLPDAGAWEIATA